MIRNPRDRRRVLLDRYLGTRWNVTFDPGFGDIAGIQGCPPSKGFNRRWGNQDYAQPDNEQVLGHWESADPRQGPTYHFEPDRNEYRQRGNQWHDPTLPPQVKEADAQEKREREAYKDHPEGCTPLE